MAHVSLRRHIYLRSKYENKPSAFADFPSTDLPDLRHSHIFEENTKMGHVSLHRHTYLRSKYENKPSAFADGL